ncbi:MAG: hypothetical protein QM784_01340 [Polyangiaceae bacterium]
MKAWLTALSVLSVACTDRLDLGSNVLFAAGHEGGDFAEWTEGERGGIYATPDTASVELSTEVAHTGHSSVRLVTNAAGVEAGSGLFRSWPSPFEAYFSTWYYLPTSYETPFTWTILRFRSAPPETIDAEAFTIDVNLRSLPDGRLVLVVVEQRQAYLAWPIAVPPPVVPIATWFQLEARFRSRSDESGMLKLWLDGKLVYDIEGRVTGQGNRVYFNPCNTTTRTIPAPAVLFVDDTLVSRTRVTPEGTAEE